MVLYTPLLLTGQTLPVAERGSSHQSLREITCNFKLCHHRYNLLNRSLLKMQASLLRPYRFFNRGGCGHQRPAGSRCAAFASVRFQANFPPDQARGLGRTFGCAHMHLFDEPTGIFSPQKESASTPPIFRGPGNAAILLLAQQLCPISHFYTTSFR